MIQPYLLGGAETQERATWCWDACQHVGPQTNARMITATQNRRPVHTSREISLLCQTHKDWFTTNRMGLRSPISTARSEDTRPFHVWQCEMGFRLELHWFDLLWICCMSIHNCRRTFEPKIKHVKTRVFSSKIKYVSYVRNNYNLTHNRLYDKIHNKNRTDGV